jgi:hypothetical protein
MSIKPSLLTGAGLSCPGIRSSELSSTASPHVSRQDCWSNDKGGRWSPVVAGGRFFRPVGKSRLLWLLSTGQHSRDRTDPCMYKPV